MSVAEHSAMKNPSAALRGALIAGAVLAYGFLVAFLALISMQLYRWFRDGEWTHIGTLDALRGVLTRCCAADDGSGKLGPLVQWFDAPVEWLGLHRLLDLMPASLTLFALSILANFIYVYCRDRIDAAVPPTTNAPPSMNAPPTTPSVTPSAVSSSAASSSAASSNAAEVR